MHQPFYLDPSSQTLILPWVRLHALKDYFGMANLLRRYPSLRLTFNLVPSLLHQLELYQEGRQDLWQQLSSIPAESLRQEEQEFILRHFFSAHVAHQIRPHRRYYELYSKREAFRAENSRQPLSRYFSAQEFRDIQIWQTLAFFDQTYQENDPFISGLIEKEGGFSEKEKQELQKKELELLSRIIPEYRELYQEGQIEIATSPYYHPIMPLLIDPQLGRASNPALPPYDLHFHWREDVIRQIETAVTYAGECWGKPVAGIWPSEGSLSSDVLKILHSQGILWTAADEENLARSTGMVLERDDNQYLRRPQVLYRPYFLEGTQTRIFFRDHLLSDLFGFHYYKTSASSAVEDITRRLLHTAQHIQGEGVVSIILDGENPWEHYPENGRKFLRTLYDWLDQEERLQTVTFTQAAETPATALSRYSAGSWINGNFDIWIGDPEDRTAWKMISRAKDELDSQRSSLSEEQVRTLREHILIAQSSDWFWWYGRDDPSSNLDSFDLLFRNHLIQVYRELNRPVPSDLLQPIGPASSRPVEAHPPQGMLSPVLDGHVTDYFEWVDAGWKEITGPSGVMHVSLSPLYRLYYGTNRDMLFLRIDSQGRAVDWFQQGYTLVLILGKPHDQPLQFTVPPPVPEKENRNDQPPWEAAFQEIIELKIPLSLLNLDRDRMLALQLRWCRGEEVLFHYPPHSSLILSIPDGDYYKQFWQV